MKGYLARLPKVFRTIDLRAGGALLIFLAISFVIYGLPVARHFTSSYIGTGEDPTMYLWAMAWWPHAVANRINPFVTTAIWAPTGCNLAWITAMPGPSFVIAPLTLVFGPIVSYNVLNILCPLTNAFCGFVLCQYVCKRFWPALFGGYVFGFSEYTLSQSIAHLSFLFIFPVPLLVYVLLKRTNLEISRFAFVAYGVMLLAFEFLCSTEIFATISVLGTFAMLLSYWLFSAGTRRTLELVTIELAIVYGVLFVLLSPYLYYVFAFGVPPPINPSSDYSNDLLAFVIPTPIILMGGRWFRSISSMMRNWWEMSGYLGPGLWTVIIFFIASKWREPVCKLLVLSLAIITIFSTGPVLHVLGVASVPMPWWLFSKLPLINQALPGRFGMYLSLLAALIGSIYLSEATYPAWLRIGAAFFCLLFLAPDWAPLIVTSAATDEPVFSKSGEYKHYISQGDNLLFLPHGGASMSLLWQAKSKFYYRIATGRVGMTPPQSAGWPILQAFDSNEEIPDFPEQLKGFLGANQVNYIALEERKRGRWPQLLAKLNLVPVSVGGVLLYHVPEEMLIAYAKATPREMAKRAALANFAMLVDGANLYIGSNFPTRELTPGRAHQLHLLEIPDNVHIRDLGNNWWRNLWLGPVGNSRVGIGILGTYEELEPVVQQYGPYSKAILFPYPKPLSRPAPTQWGQLLLIFDREELALAAKTGHFASRVHSPY